jgi:hypothetical protein
MLDADRAALLIDQLLNIQSILGRAGCALGRTRTNNGRDTKGAKTRFIAPVYGKFESSSLQRRVCCEPDFLDHGWRRRSLAVQSRSTVRALTRRPRCRSSAAEGSSAVEAIA